MKPRRLAFWGNLCVGGKHAPSKDSAMRGQEKRRVVLLTFSISTAESNVRVKSTFSWAC